jgi:septal ring factor EnvC (AmiA/AmiB activator)
MEFIKNLFETVLEFIKTNRYWFELGAVALIVLILLIVIVVLAVKNRKNKKHGADLLAEFTKKTDELNESIKLFEADLDERDAIINAFEDKVQELTSEIEAKKEDYEELWSKLGVVENEKAKLVADLKVANKTLRENEEAYNNDLQAVVAEKVKLAEEYSKYSQSQSERIRALGAELESQKEINSALTVAVKELSKKSETQVADAKRVTKKTKKVELSKSFEEMSREELLLAARNVGVKGYSKMKKDDLVNALNTKVNKK